MVARFLGRVLGVIAKVKGVGPDWHLPACHPLGRVLRALGHPLQGPVPHAPPPLSVPLAH